MPNATVRANARTLPEATTNRRAVLGAVLAAGAMGATAAIPAIAKPSLGADHPEFGTAQEWAALEFEPIDADTLARLKPPSNEELNKFTGLLVSLRMAWLTIGKTKDELKEIIRRLGLGDNEAGIEMIESIGDAAHLFRTVADMLDSARIRCLSVASVLELEESAGAA